MKISIVGWYGMNNVGDEAFRFVFPQFFEDHEIEFIKAGNKCNNPDIVILGGGAVASPYYLKELPSCTRYAIGIDIAWLSEIDLLAKADFKAIYVRNGTDLSTMKQKIGCPVFSIPDLAFLIQPTKNQLLANYTKTEKKKLGVLVTDYVNPAIDRPINKFRKRADNFIMAMAKQLDLLSKDYEIVLIPCSTGGYGDDRRINLDICAFMSNRPTVIMDTLSPQDMIDLIAELDATICQRFHAHVFSIIAGTPFVSIDFTRKVMLLLEENNLTYTKAAKFEGDEFDASNIKATLEFVLNKTTTSQLRKLASGYHDELKLSVIPQVRRDCLR